MKLPPIRRTRHASRTKASLSMKWCKEFRQKTRSKECFANGSISAVACTNSDFLVRSLAFIDWYCSEPRLSFNRTVVLRYRIHLESRNLAPGTINVRLAAVRRLAY